MLFLLLKEAYLLVCVTLFVHMYTVCLICLSLLEKAIRLTGVTYASTPSTILSLREWGLLCQLSYLKLIVGATESVLYDKVILISSGITL